MDVRWVSCSIKHGLIIKAWLDLPVGGHFILWNDHDPAKLRGQLAAQWPGTFSWEYLPAEAGEFRVWITKRKELAELREPIVMNCGH